MQNIRVACHGVCLRSGPLFNVLLMKGTFTSFVFSGLLFVAGLLFPVAMEAQTPVVGIPCYVNGPYNSSPGDAQDAFVAVLYTPGAGAASLSSGASAVKHLATFGQIGATWGAAYDRRTNNYYAAAALKRHSGYGPSGSGAIYKISANEAAPAVSLLIDLDGQTGNLPGGGTVVINTGDASDHGSLGTLTTPGTDNPAFGLAGKTGLGDIDVSGHTLWVVNTAARQLIQIDITNPGSPSIVMVYPINTATTGVVATDGELRPWGIEIGPDGSVYVGVVATAENVTPVAPLTAGPIDLNNTTIRESPDNRAKLKGYVFRLDASTGSFTQSMVIDLNYLRGNPLVGLNNTVEWLPWFDDYTQGFPNVGDGYFQLYPQPIVADMEILDDGSMLVSLMDRFGLQTGSEGNSKPGASVTYNERGRASGDVVRVASTGSMTWSSSISNFYGDIMTVEDEGALGGIAYQPGTNEFIAVAVDPVAASSNGLTVIGLAGVFIDNQTLVSYAGGSGEGANPLLGSKGLALGDVEIGNEGLAPCSISNITFSNQGSCNDNGTGNIPTDDWFTADITVTFAMPPATGNLVLTGDVLTGGGAISVTVATAGAGPTYTFTGVRLKADATASVVTATFSDDLVCSFIVTNGPSEAPCSVPVCMMTNITFANASACNDNGSNSNSNDDWFTSDITVFFEAPPGSGTLDLTGDVIAGGGVTSVSVGAIGGGPSYTFTGVRLRADGTASSVTATFSTNNACTFGIANGPTLGSCSCANPIANLIQVPATCTGVVTPDNNGRIVLMGASNVDRYGVSFGAPYTGVAYGSAIAVGPLPFNIQSGIPNTGGTYTVRVFNGSDACFYDYYIIVPGLPCPVDPMGYIYCEETGQIITGGTISVSGPGTTLITQNGSAGSYQFYTDGTPGVYTLTYTPPVNYSLSTSRLPGGTLDPTGQPDPYIIGSGSTDGVVLNNFTAAANPFYLSIDFELGDPEVFNNNIPLEGCALSIGSTVFLDFDNNGLLNGADVGIPNVELLLYRVVGNKDGAGNNETDDVLVDTGSDGNAVTPTDGMNLRTDANGNYLFSYLISGRYYVVVPATQFATGAVLEFSNISSADIATTPFDNGVDNDDNGIQMGGAGGMVMSPAITLSVGNEPVDAGTETGQGNTLDNGPPLRDANGDMTVDFGFVCSIAAEAGVSQTVCSTRSVQLNLLGASVTPASLGGVWSTSGDGTFTDGGGLPATALGTAVMYIPGPNDIQAGTATLTLTTNNPGTLVPPSACPPVSDTVIINILRVNCGSFPWNGN